MLKILFVCATNHCLSPLVAGHFSRLLAKRGLTEKVQIDSAGTHPGMETRGVERRTLEFALEKGIDLSSHRTREVRASDIENFDLIVVMSDEDFWHVNNLSPEKAEGKIRLFLYNYSGDFTRRALPDPVLGQDSFESVDEVIEHTCEKMLDALLADHLI